MGARILVIWTAILTWFRMVWWKFCCRKFQILISYGGYLPLLLSCLLLTPRLGWFLGSFKLQVGYYGLKHVGLGQIHSVMIWVCCCFCCCCSVNRKIKGSLTGVNTGTTEKVWNSFQALGDIAFAYSFSMILIEIQVKEWEINGFFSVLNGLCEIPRRLKRGTKYFFIKV